MTNYAINTDAGADFPLSLLEYEAVKMIPMDIQYDDKSFLYDIRCENISNKTFYDSLREGKTPSTSMVTSQQYMHFWREYLENGLDIIYICLSSDISGTYEQSQLAAKFLKEEYPDRKVEVIDSKIIASAQGYLFKAAIDNREKGMSFEDNIKSIRQKVEDFRGFAVIEDMSYLRRSGRLTTPAAIVGKTLKIKPIMQLKGGGVAECAKARGIQKAFRMLVEQCEKEFHGGFITIGHGDNLKRAQLLKKKLDQTLGYQEINIIPLSPIIGCHVGPSAITFAYLNE